MAQRLVEEMARWLASEAFEWDAFATLTFGERFGATGPSPERCLHHARRWLDSLPHRPSWFLAVETGRFGRTHAHALLGSGDAVVPRTALWRSWHRRYGRARIEPIRPLSGENAAFYVAKYLTKAPELWDLRAARPDVDVVPVARDADVIGGGPAAPPQTLIGHDAAERRFHRPSHTEP